MHNANCVMDRGHHCGACHRTFGTLGLFDAHRVGHVDNRQCLGPMPRPSAPGLYVVLDAYGVWQTPEGLEARKSRSANVHKAQAARRLKS